MVVVLLYELSGLPGGLSSSVNLDPHLRNPRLILFESY